LYKILIIEDEETIRHYISVLLGTLGYETIEAASGAQGLKLAEEHEPDTILMDIMMPSMDGIETCKRLKTNEPLKDTPIIMVTAKTDDETIERAFDAGAFDYISKPLNKLEAKTRIKSALNYKKLNDLRKTKDEDLEKKVRARTAELALANEKLRTEIEERIEREKRLRFLEKALETIDLGVTVADMDGKIIYTNPAEAAMHGYTAYELIGKDVGLFAPSEARRRIIAESINKIKSKRRESINIKKDGSEFPVYLISTIVENSQNEPIAVITACKDITEIKIAEETKMQLEAQLRQSQKMETIGTLAGGIAHDFNNILTPILTFAEVAMLELEDKSDLRHYLSSIYEAGERARDLVSHILTFSRQAELEMQPIKMKYIVREALKLLSRTLPATIEIKRNIRGDLTVLADPSQLHQIVMNLCTNAFHAMEETGGVLSISLKDADIDMKTACKYPDMAPGKYLQLKISDTGTGMTKAIMDKIFDPFFTSKSTGKGTGMGLSVVHGIVKSHKGIILVKSEPKKGSTFEVLLPEINAPGKISKKTMKEKKVWQGKVLIVDDDKLVAESIGMLLKVMGFTTTISLDSLKALDLFKDKPEHFDLIITDMTMPNMTGDTLSKELLKVDPNIPIIICTGFSEHIDEEKALKLGAKAYVMKPVLKNSLEDAIERSLDKKHLKNPQYYQI
jgi:PAS domain S-box-containing protein